MGLSGRPSVRCVARADERGVPSQEETVIRNADDAELFIGDGLTLVQLALEGGATPHGWGGSPPVVSQCPLHRNRNPWSCNHT